MPRPKESRPAESAVTAKLPGQSIVLAAVGLHVNPFSPVVPCHRVVVADGRIGGFASGTRTKIKLLKQEGIEINQGKVVDFKTKFLRLKK